MTQREQQTARINVDDTTWQTFRIRAIQADRSVADELARPPRPQRPPPRPAGRPAGAIDHRVACAGGTGVHQVRAEREGDAAADPRRRPKQRLADLDLLTELPYRPHPPSRPPDADDYPPRR